MDPFTRLIELPELAKSLNLQRIWLKDEGERPLGNFKSLGGLRAGTLALGRPGAGNVLICASDGNHGLAVAAAAHAADAEARIYLPRHVRGVRIERIADLGARILHVDGTYDMAVLLAEQAADRGEGILVPDTSSDARNAVVADVLSGYGRISSEIIDQLGHSWPTHIFVQAGVGGLAASLASGLLEHRRALLVIVEPVTAACVGLALAAGRPVQCDGDLVTCADMLSCGLASAAAIEILRQFDCVAVVASEHILAEAPGLLLRHGGPATTPSGAAGLAGLMAAADIPGRLGLDAMSRVLLLSTEGAIQ